MFNFFILICTVISAMAAPVESQPWKKLVHPVKGFSDHQVQALGAKGDEVFVASFLPKKKRSSFEVLNIKTGAVKDLSGAIHLNPQDSVSAILVNAAKGEYWIAMNNNLSSANCFDTAWKSKKCDRAFLQDQLDYIAKFKDDKMGSIETAAHDEKGGVIGEFKGAIYLVNPAAQKTLVFQPANHYYWAAASALTPNTAIISTRGEGLVTVSRDGQNAKRFPDAGPLDFVAAIAVSGNQVFLGSNGLFKSPLDKLTK